MCALCGAVNNQSSNSKIIFYTIIEFAKLRMRLLLQECDSDRKVQMGQLTDFLCFSSPPQVVNNNKNNNNRDHEHRHSKSNSNPYPHQGQVNCKGQNETKRQLANLLLGDKNTFLLLLLLLFNSPLSSCVVLTAIWVVSGTVACCVVSCLPSVAVVFVINK